MPQSNHFVSVIIPARNAALHIRQAIDSVLSQTHRHLEVIVVDDGSTDGTPEIVRAYRDPRVRFFRQEAQGACAARNKGLEVSEGDFVQYLDSDDLLDENKLARQLNLFDSKHPGMLFSCTWARFDKAIKDANFTIEGVFGDFKPVDWLLVAFGMGGMMALHAWLIPRPVALAAGKWNTALTINQDGEYMCRVVLSSEGVKFCPEAKVYYRNSGQKRVSAGRSAADIKSKFRVCELNAGHLLERENSIRTRAACANLFQHFCYKNYPEAGELIDKADEYIEHYGGADVVPGGTMSFRVLEKIVGWKKARTLERKIRNVRTSLNI